MRYVLVVDGASASSRDTGNKLIGVVRGCLADRLDRIHIHEINQSFFANRTDAAIGAFIRVIPKGASLLIVCKSQGADRVVSHLMHNRYPEITIRVISIDPHHWATGVRRLFSRPGLWAEGYSCANYYQSHHWPHGAKITGALNLEVENVNHWNIIFHKAIKRAIRLWG